MAMHERCQVPAITAVHHVCQVAQYLQAFVSVALYNIMLIEFMLIFSII